MLTLKPGGDIWFGRSGPLERPSLSSSRLGNFVVCSAVSRTLRSFLCARMSAFRGTLSRGKIARTRFATTF